MKAKLTTGRVKSLQPQEKTYKVWDTELKGFFLRISPKGTKTYCVFYRVTGNGRDVKIGLHGTLTADQARKEAKTVLADASRGIDIQATKKEAKLKAKQHNLSKLGQFIDNNFGLWALQNQKGGAESIRVLNTDFSFLLDTPMGGITPKSLTPWIKSQQDKNRKPTTINRKLAILRGVLSRAVEHEIIDIHPLRGLKDLKTVTSPLPRYLDQSEVSRLLTALDQREDRIRAHRLSGNEWRRARHKNELPILLDHQFADHIKPLVLLAMHTGMRRGELFQLEWCDINFAVKDLFIRPEISKSGRSRHIPLNKTVMKCLRVWREQSAFKSKQLVFPSPDTGGVLDNINSAWRNLLKSADITSFRFHDLRHHFASKLVMAGEPLNTVRELLGHSSLEMTMRYAHLSPDHKQAAVDKLG